MIVETPLTLPAEPGVTLEARLATPPDPRAGFAMCHPHPLYGGDMDNPVVIRAVEVAGALGLATIRFNFRGVGESTGTHGAGATEVRDLAAALDRLRTRLPDGAPIVAGGYSFGSIVAANVAAAGGVDALALIAPPLGIGDGRRLPALPRPLPVFVGVGSADEYCPSSVIDRLRAEFTDARIDVVDGANHFFFGTLVPLGEALRGWLETTVEALRAGQSGRRGRAR